MNNDQLIQALIKAFSETIQIVFVSLFIAVIIGGLLGLLLFITADPLFVRNRTINQLVGTIVNITRSIPFIILLVLLLPFTKLVVGTTIGSISVIVPLSVAAIAFFARLAEVSFSEVSHGVLEAAVASGSKIHQIVFHILIPEALPQLIKNITVTAVSLIGYSAMAGTVGGGGVGDLAIRYGYQRYQTQVMLICVALLIIMVQALQVLGDYAAKRVNKK